MRTPAPTRPPNRADLPVAWVRVLAVICDRHGRRNRYGSSASAQRVPGLLLPADQLRRGASTCKDCIREGIGERHPLRFETEPVSEEYVLRKRPRMARDLAKLQAWSRAATGWAR